MVDKSIIERLNIKIIPSDKHEFLVSTKDIAEGYGVTVNAIHNHKQRRADEIVEGTHFIHTDSVSKKEGLQWTRRGGIKLGMFIHSEIAIEFRNELENLAIRELDNDIQQMLALNEQMATVLKHQLKTEEKVKSLNNGQQELIVAHQATRDKVEAIANEIIDITKPQKKLISVKIMQLVRKFKYMYPDRTEGQLRASFWGILVDWIGVTKYDDIPKSRFAEAMNILNFLEVLTEEHMINLNQYIEVWQVQALWDKVEFPKYQGNHQTTLDF